MKHFMIGLRNQGGLSMSRFICFIRASSKIHTCNYPDFLEIVNILQGIHIFGSSVATTWTLSQGNNQCYIVMYIAGSLLL